MASVKQKMKVTWHKTILLAYWADSKVADDKNCWVHRAKSVCDLFTKHDTTTVAYWVTFFASATVYDCISIYYHLYSFT